jgi:hypothetical protein
MRLAHGGASDLRVVSAISIPIWRTGSKTIRLPACDQRRTHMISVFEMIREAAVTYARYRKTRDEIANLPLDVALDLDIYPGDADRIARRAVYGKAA